MTISSKLAGLLLPSALALALAVGCGDSGLTANSSCKDFMEASQEDQSSAISKLSGQFDTPEIATPLGSPSIAYTCSSNPDMSLEAVFRRYHEGED